MTRVSAPAEQNAITTLTVVHGICRLKDDIDAAPDRDAFEKARKQTAREFADALRIMIAKPGIERGELAEKLGISKSDIRQDIETLRQWRLVTFSRLGRQERYHAALDVPSLIDADNSSGDDCQSC